MQEEILTATEKEESFLIAEQDDDSETVELIQAPVTAAMPRPLQVVPYVRLLNSSDPSDCPYDRYMMYKKMAKLEYSKNKKGGQVIALKVLLSSCPQCERLYIDQPQLLGLKNVGLDIGGFDIIGSSKFPRTKGYENWHPEATRKPVEVAAPVKVKKARKPAVKKVKAVKETVVEAVAEVPAE